MKKSNLFSISGTLLFFFLLPIVAHASRLDLSEGTMTLGGQLTFNIGASDMSNITSKDLSANILLDGGFFLYDNFEVSAVLGTMLLFDSPVKAEVSMGAGARYYFDIESMFFPYLGTQPKFKWAGQGAVSNWAFQLPVMAGLLVGLNSHVALDVGVLTSFTWAIGSANTPTALNLSVGYIGIKSFF